ncbi:MAG: PilZ domain-containing protein [Clostridium sp.]|nr:PilZ domain-containing protein [Clostridium sp.]
MDSKIDELNVNTKCEILIDNKVYKSNVQDIDKNAISISLPVSNGEYAMPSKGVTVEVIYYDKNNVYSFITDVVGRKTDKVKLIVLNKPAYIKKVQRRKFFRIEVSKEAQFIKIDKELNKESINKVLKNTGEFFKGFIVDISGGGFKFISSQNIKKDDFFLAKIPIENESIPVICKCVRSDKDAITKANVCGFSFYKIDDKARDKIVVYIFKLMREHMKKN